MGKSSHYKDDYAIKEFGRKIRELRKNKGLSIEQLANSVDMHVNQLGRIERGEGNISISYIFRMAEIFGVTPASLLDFDDKK